MAAPDTDHWRRVRQLFDEVADLDGPARDARLTERCGDDAALRAEVESLLVHDRVAHDPIAEVLGAAAARVVQSRDVQAGQSLLHYTCTEQIGQGGMGVVWKATDRSLGRDVAIKVLPAGVGDDPVRLARFDREAKLLASLNHSNIAAIFSVHECAGVHFLAMEYVPGEDLAQRLARGALPIDECLSIARQIADALEEAHERGVVHRDLKPANVKLTPAGKVKVLDFGLAKAFLGEVAPESGVSTSTDGVLAVVSTRAGVILGTAAYMPPEQARGFAVDKRADVWAFGVVLFEMLAGQRPFPGATVVDQLAAIITAEPDWTLLPAATPPALVQLLRRCLQKDVRQRLRDIGEARIQLERLEHDARAAAPAATLASGGRWTFRRAALAAAVALAATLGLGVWIGRDARTDAAPAATRSIAVLPLADLSAGPHEDYFADGLSEELLNLLARNPRLRVAGRTSAFRVRTTAQDLRAVGARLGVDTLLEGSVRRSGNRVRITAQLVNVADGFHIWSNAYDREMDDILTVQDDIARAVAAALQVALLGDRGEVPSTRTHNGPAYDAYLQGKFFRRRNTKEGLEKAVAYFEQAVRLDPALAPAWAGLSLTRSNIGAEGYAPPDNVFGEARRAAERAVALDPDLAEGHVALSLVRRAYDWDWAGADAAAQRALQIEPSNADIVLSAARIASTLGRIDEALTLTRRAAALDPLNVQVHYRLGRYQQFVGQLDEARASLSKALELDGDYPAAHENLALVLLAQGRSQAALAELAREQGDPWLDHGTAIASHFLGRPADADAALARIVNRLPDVAAFQIAQIHALRGRSGEAMDWLDRAYLQRDTGLSQLKSTAYFEQLAGEPRYQAFLDKMRLPR